MRIANQKGRQRDGGLRPNGQCYRFYS